MINFLENDLLNTTELADLVVEQSNVGSTIKVADSAEVYGFISVINMHQHHVRSLLTASPASVTSRNLEQRERTADMEVPDEQNTQRSVARTIQKSDGRFYPPPGLNSQ